MNVRRLVSWLLLFVFCIFPVLNLTACGSRKAPKHVPKKADGVWAAGDELAAPEGVRFSHDCFSVPADTDGKTVLFSAWTEDRTGLLLLTADAGTGEITASPFPGADSFGTDAIPSLYAFTALPDGGLASVFSESRAFHLLVTDRNGALVSRARLDEFSTSSDNVSGIVVSPKTGTLYLYSAKVVSAYAQDGTRLWKTSPGRTLGMGLSTAGDAYVCYYPSRGIEAEDFAAPVIAYLDDAAKGIGDTVPVPDSINLYNARILYHPDYDLCYTASEGIRGWNFPAEGTEIEEAAPSEKIVDLTNSDLDRFTDAVFPSSDTVMLYSVDISEGVGRDRLFYRFAERVPEEDIPEKYEIRVACSGISSVLSDCARIFNRQSETCRIVFDSYEQYTADKYDDVQEVSHAYEVFQNDVLLGYRPDIVLGDGTFPLETLTAQGLFCDLYPFMENDPDFDADMLLDCVRTPFEREDGALPYLVLHYTLRSVAAKQSDADRFGAWDIAAAKKAAGTLQAGQQLLNLNAYGTSVPLYLLQRLIPLSGETTVTDPGALGELLSFCASMTENDTRSGTTLAEAFSAGDVLAAEFLFDFYAYLGLRYKTLGGEVPLFIGYPHEEGNGTLIRASSALGITKDAMQNDAVAAGAWEFLKLTASYEDPQLAGIYPMSVGCTKAQLESAFEKMNDYYFYFVPGYGLASASQPLTQYPEEYRIFLTEEDKASLRTLFDGAAVREDKDPELISIVCEDASACFENAKSLEETAKIITARAKNYLSEKN